MAHLNKDAVLYMPPNLIEKGGPGGAVCGRCIMYLGDTSQCAILRPPQVNGEHGVCGLFVGGKPTTSEEHPPMKIVPAEVAGYVTTGPTKCGNCKYFEDEHRIGSQGNGTCEVIKGIVNARGCCNAWSSNHEY